MEITQSILQASEEQIVSLIYSAQKRLAFLGPGLSDNVAQAIVETWQKLGPNQVKIVLDLDPEVFRLGYGVISAVSSLVDFANQRGEAIGNHPGIRICILIIDENMLVYTPTPQLIEAGTKRPAQPNALYFFDVPYAVLKEIGWAEDAENIEIIGKQKLSLEIIEATLADLETNPPLQFDLARQVLVFNSQLEFVEVEVLGCKIESKTVSLPREFMAFISDESVRSRIRSTYRLVDENSNLTGTHVERAKKNLVDEFLVLLPSYGQVILRTKKPKFLEEIGKLKHLVAEFQQDVREKLQEELDNNRKRLFGLIYPQIVSNPPRHWLASLGPDPDEDAIKRRLDAELQTIFGNAEKYTNEMKVKVIFKAITYEMLTDDAFIKLAHQKFPDIKSIYDQYLAAPNTQPTLF